MAINGMAKPISLAATFTVVLAMLGLLVVNRGIQKAERRAESDPDSLTFDVSFEERVAMRIATVARYGLGADADSEWDHILPRDGHLVYVSDNKSMPTAHTVTLFHQLKCLQILRTEYQAAPDVLSHRAQHCFNYLRQTILCGLNLRLESVRDDAGMTDHNYYDTVCRDWNRVWE